MTNFADQPTGRTQEALHIAKKEYKWIGFVALGGLIAVACIFTVIFFTAKSERDKAQISMEQDAARNTAVDIVLKAIAALQDSSQERQRRSDSVFTFILQKLEHYHGDGFREFTLPPAPFIDTAFLRHQIQAPMEKK